MAAEASMNIPAYIPVITPIKAKLLSWAENPSSQKILILVIVSVALLLDNMLYMVIVPIIPHYLREKNKTYILETGKDNVTVRKIKWMYNQADDAELGILFASKAIVQLLVNPITGTIIDRVGYDKPMMAGLTIIFLSTVVFAFGHSYSVMFIARSLQGLGSAFADTSGLAMIADRFTEEQERSKALGIALAFISFGSLVAPPFGGILYQFMGKEFPFMFLALVALADGCIMLLVMQPIRAERRMAKSTGELAKGTPIWRLLVDPYIAICAGALAMSNVSLAFLEPTISNWMQRTFNAENWQVGLVWLPAFLPHVAGVYSTVVLARNYPKYQWLMAAIGLVMEGVSCIFIPFTRSFGVLMIPICTICYGIALVDTALLPTLGYVVDTRYVSIYGSVYAIADISYSLAYAFGPIVAGGLVNLLGFVGMNMAIMISNVAYAPALIHLRNIYKYDNFVEESRNAADEGVSLVREGGEGGGDTGANRQQPPHYRTYVMNGKTNPDADINGGYNVKPLLCSNSDENMSYTKSGGGGGGEGDTVQLPPPPPPQFQTAHPQHPVSQQPQRQESINQSQSRPQRPPPARATAQAPPPYHSVAAQAAQKNGYGY